jgi:hypothetical protein
MMFIISIYNTNYMDQRIENTFKHGIYYNPATSHYLNQPNCNVVCDMCNRSSLKICIGYDDCDLCMRCADTLSTNALICGRVNIPLTRMKQSMYDPSDTCMATFMMQEMYDNKNKSKNSSNSKKFMMNGMFKNNYSSDSDSDC